ncbi:hypothetical protein OIDMADRAFT_150361 [Oidiodendron maius Zn]|uniref:Uncharacterized protein n=1 Tax=Oidiodendron maius (strain Zn) TaxID=913774 RepID=A0A0C3D706_OIDMZ|nr:hypothetical protein OIDMADRAFT_150361 [Oidiodendron maius Zn]
MSLLIRHWNPNVDNDLVNLLKYSWYRQEERSLPVGLAPQEGESALHSSVRNADLGAIERLISEGHSLDVFDSRGYTPLHTAAARGRIDVLELLLLQCTNLEVRSQTFNKDTPLTWTATEGTAESINILLDHGAEIETVLGDGLRPIHLAAQCANYKITQMLLEGNVPLDINVCTSDRLQGRSALHYAVLNGEPRVVKLLLQKGADVNARDIGGQTPSDYSVSSKNSSIQELLADSSRKKRKE